MLFVGPLRSGGVATVNLEVQKLAATLAGIECCVLENTAYMLSGRRRKLIRYLGHYAALVVVILRSRPNVVMVQASQRGYFHQSMFAFIAKVFRKATILHFHAKPDVPAFEGFWTRKAICLSEHFIDKLVVLADASKESLIRQGWKRPITVLPNFIHLEDYPAQPSDIATRPVDVISIGRMIREKGIFEVLQVAGLLRNSRFLFIGDFTDDALKAEFQHHISRLNNARWLGPVYGQEKIGYLTQSKLLLMPTHTEVFPLVLLECAACGVVPLVTAVGAIPELIRDGFNGFAIERDDPGAIARKIESLLSQPAFLRRLSVNSRQSLCERYTAESVRGLLTRILGKWDE